MPFVKGKSGNPGGVSKLDKQVKELAKKSGVKCIAFLNSVLDNPEACIKDKISAANSLLDRGYGKPAQQITGEDGGPIKITVAYE